MNEGRIEIVRADQLRPGDVFSTDGAIVQHVEHKDSRVHVEAVCHGAHKDAVLAPDFPCPLWREKDAYEALLERARKAGEEHGRAAGSWYFDGNTSNETYAAVLRGIEDGDPAVLDTFPSSPLSGECADSMTPTKLCEELGLDAHAEATFNPEGFDELCSAYEGGFSQASQDEIVRVARYHVSSDEEA